jgi:hypothetical protein
MTRTPSRLESWFAWFLMVWIWVLITAACGVGLVMQQHESRAQAYAAEETCGRAAEAVAGAEASADRLRDAYQVCMDDHTITRPEGWTAPRRQPG